MRRVEFGIEDPLNERGLADTRLEEVSTIIVWSANNRANIASQKYSVGDTTQGKCNYVQEDLHNLIRYGSGCREKDRM